MNPRYQYINKSQANAPRVISRTQKSFLNLAQKAAGASECVQRHGAVVVRGGSVLSIGVNKWRNDMSLTNDMFNDGRSADVSVHAEIDALSRVANPAGATIYIARINKAGEPRLSGPCNDCSEALDNAGITKIVYTIN